MLQCISFEFVLVVNSHVLQPQHFMLVILAFPSKEPLTKCDVTAWKEGEGTVIVRMKNQRL
jgi:hypothetical protein